MLACHTILSVRPDFVDGLPGSVPLRLIGGEHLPLGVIADCLDVEETETVMKYMTTGELGDQDGFEGWVDEAAILSPEKREQLRVNVLPVKIVLVKVGRSARITAAKTHLI